ncbi:MAG: hypothetical protein V1739_01790 [Candidatus Omnitrophota bacterium]
MQKSKRNKAQAMVVVFIYISVVSLMGVYMMVYAANLNTLVIREINHTKAFYAGEAALIQSFASLCGGGGVSNMSFPPMTVTVDSAGIGNGYTRIRATVSNWQQW